MHRSLRRSLAIVASCTWTLAPHGYARAEAPSPSPASVSAPGNAVGTTADARKEFLEGTSLLQQSNWAEALAAFERAEKLRPHAITAYNIAACQRALGQYVRARDTFLQSLAEDEASGHTELSGSLATDIRALLAEIDHLVATAAVTLSPADAALAVDGRPLEMRKDANGVTKLFAGTRSAGLGESPPNGEFQMVIDPGLHVLTLSRKGFADIVVNRTFPPAKETVLRLELDRLPATLHIASSEAGAIVRVDGADVGIAPIDVLRPTGTYRVTVSKMGFDPYETRILAQPGDEVNLQAALKKEKIGLTQRWWFWTGVGVVLAGAATTTYLLARPDPTRPDVNAGGLNWAVPVK